MGNSDDRRVARIAPESPTQIIVRDRLNVLVLIGGTTEPGNLGGGHRADSYSRPGVSSGDPSYWGQRMDYLQRHRLLDPERWYWQDNPNLRAAIAELERQYTNLVVFEMHGWSGDNSVFNRQVAGKYLADRLCGAEGESAYYAAWLSREVHFHVMAHSHGGNVLNEFTREAARVWPARWKIRTVVYLSTPFFQHLHPVDTGAFDPDCKIISVTDDYDLTQNVLADFNLHQLHQVLLLSGFAAVGRAASAVSTAGATAFAGLATDFRLFLLSIHVHDADPSLLGMAPEFRFDPALAARVYGHILAVITPLRSVLREVHSLIEQLRQGVEFPTWVELVGRICQGRQILSDALARRWHDFIDDLDHAIATTEAAFASRVTSGVFRPSEVLSDFESPVFLAIARHLAVGPGSNDEVPEPGSLASPLTDLLVATLLEQIDEYDDTLTTPDRLYAGTAHAGHIISVNVSERDDYGKPPQAAYAERARNFLNRLRTIEARYQERGVPDDLVDLVLTMAAAHPPVRAAVTSWWPHIDSICRLFDWMQINIIDALRALPGFPSAFGSATPTLLSILRAFIQFVNTAWLWCTHLRERDVGELMVQPPAKSSWRNGPDDPFMGELAYLAYVSHSQSRFDLYPEVRQELEAQLTTRRRRTPRADASSSP